ncbi:MAG TPA: alpha/beta hydrolase [Candidatus Dormibacteraeota bacterium]|nr:alpha/beta hydrolase [Candidatus Dormibacteraeota bacterium]
MEWPAAGELRRVQAGDGTELTVYALGKGPPLLLIPGLGTDHHAFVWNIRQMAEHFECLVLDQRGVGRSEATPGPYTIELLADDAASVLRHSAPQGASVMGVSMGGMVAQQLAIRHPRLVTKLVLGCTGPGGRLAVRAAPEVTRSLLGGDAKDPASAYRIICQVLYEPSWSAAHPEVIEDAIDWRAHHPLRPGVFQAHWQAARHHDAGALLATIEAPTLILQGTADVVMPPGNAEALRAGIEGSLLTWFAGRGHMFFQEDPERTLSLLCEALLPAGPENVSPAPPSRAVPDTIATRKGEG